MLDRLFSFRAESSEKHLRLLVLTKYGRLGASSRVRTIQYFPYLERSGWSITHQALLSDSYVESCYSGTGGFGVVRAIRLCWAFIVRFFYLLGMHRYDVVWIEKELYPYFPSVFEAALSKVGKKVLVDYDDALFHLYDQHKNPVVRFLLKYKIDRVMRSAACVVVGNSYLGDRARLAGAERIVYIPTVVDLHRWKPLFAGQQVAPVVIGWIGTPVTSQYLDRIASALNDVLGRRNTRLVCVGGRSKSIVHPRVEFREWSEDKEVVDIQTFDIGIMPIPEGPWELGKCGYKLIQYMSCGLPVVASPVGVNAEIVRDGVSGFHATSNEEWVESLLRLIDSYELRKSMGSVGRQLVEAHYSVQVQFEGLHKALERVAKGI